MPTLEFWYEFASTYSYPAAMRIEDVARAKGVTVQWQPFLLGPIFAQQGWTTSPFNLYPAKGKNMVRDLERICAKAQLPFTQPDPFPQNSLLAARVACALDEDMRPAFSKAIYALEFGQGRRIDEPEAIATVVATIGLDSHAVLTSATGPEGKERLKTQGAMAAQRSIYGAPSFVTAGGELFWGNDRLEQAVEWAAGEVT